MLHHHAAISWQDDKELPRKNYLKMVQTSLIVIPAKAGIQVFPGVLDPGFRRGDGVSEF